MFLGIIIGIIICLAALYYLHKSGKLTTICTKVKALLSILKLFKPKSKS